MRYFKIEKDGYVLAVGIGKSGEEITAEEYGSILDAIRNHPVSPEGYCYRLTDVLEWELCELPVVVENDPELSAEEALDIILGGDANA